MLFPPLPYVSLLLLAIGAAAIPPKRVHKLSDLVSTHHHTGGQPPHQPPTTTIRDAQGQAEHGQSSNVHAPHHAAPHGSTETPIPDDASTSSATKHARKKAYLGIQRGVRMPIHYKKISKEQIEKGTFALHADFQKSQEEKERVMNQAKTEEERQRLREANALQRTRKKKALFGLHPNDGLPAELKGMPLEEIKARLIETFAGRAEGLFSPDLLARAASAMHHSQQGTETASTTAKLQRKRKAESQRIPEHHRPDRVLPFQTSSDRTPVWREGQQQAHEAEHGQSSNVHAPHRAAPHGFAETHTPDDALAAKRARDKLDSEAQRKDSLGVQGSDKIPIQSKRFMKGRFAADAEYQTSKEEKDRMLGQAKTVEEYYKLLEVNNHRRSKEKKALFGLRTNDVLSPELKGISLEETKARLIETFAGRAKGLFSPELLAMAASAMQHSQQGTAPAHKAAKVRRRRKSGPQLMREHHTEPAAGPDYVIPHQTSSDGAPVWRAGQQQAPEGSSSGQGNADTSQAAQPSSPFLFDFEWPPTP